MGRFGPGMRHEYAGGQSESDLANSISRVLSTARRVNLRIWVNAARTGLTTWLDGLNMQNKKATRFIIEWLYVKLNQIRSSADGGRTGRPIPCPKAPRWMVPAQPSGKWYRNIRFPLSVVRYP